ncbi:MAG: ABC transporter permease [Nitrososphaeria archaeon]|nr:ABC transporter permease [Nitrososphaeria archaeon]
MRTEDILWLGFKSLKTRKVRGALTILSVVIGVASIIGLVSQTAGIQASVLSTLQSLGPTTLLVTPARTTTLTQADIARMMSIPGVEGVVPVVSAQMRLTRASEVVQVNVIGVDSIGLKTLLGEVRLLDGEIYPPSNTPLAIVGNGVAFSSTQGIQEVYVGQPITLEQPLGSTGRRITLQVAGILDKYGSSAFLSTDNSIFIPIDYAMNIFNRRAYSYIIVKAANVESVNTVSEYLTTIYGRNISIINVQQITQAVSTIMGFFSILLGSVAAISLSVAGLGIMNIMLVSVYERTKEIGLLKAIGFKDRNVLTIFLSEAMLVGIIGGILGIVAGAGASQLVPTLIGTYFGSSNLGGGGGFQGGGAGMQGAMASFSYTPVITLDVVGIALITAVSVSVLSGLYPAWRASKMEPIKALRYE